MSETLDPAAPPAGGAEPPAGGASPPAASWLDGLPDDIKAAPSLSKYKDVGDLAKAYVNAEKLIGRGGVVIPKDGDAPEVTAKFRAAMGVPEKPEDYAIKPPEGLPESIWSEASAKEFQGWAHELGLSPKQAQQLAEKYAGHALAARDAIGLTPDGKPAEEALRAEWGREFDTRKQQAQQAVKEFGGPELVEFLQRTGLGNNPAMVRAWAKIGAELSEDRPAGMGTGRGVMGKEAASQERQRLMADPKGPYWNPMDPQHKATVARVTELVKMEGE